MGPFQLEIFCDSKNLETYARAVILERSSAWRKGRQVGSSMIRVGLPIGVQLAFFFFFLSAVLASIPLLFKLRTWCIYELCG